MWPECEYLGNMCILYVWQGFYNKESKWCKILEEKHKNLKLIRKRAYLCVEDSLATSAGVFNWPPWSPEHLTWYIFIRLWNITKIKEGDELLDGPVLCSVCAFCSGELWSWGFFVDCGVTGVEPESQSQPCLCCALSIPRTSQHGSTVNKGCSVSATGGSIIYAFNRLPNPLPPLPPCSRLFSPTHSPSGCAAPSAQPLLLTQLHVDMRMWSVLLLSSNLHLLLLLLMYALMCVSASKSDGICVSVRFLQTKHQRAELSYLVDRPRRVNR